MDLAGVMKSNPCIWWGAAMSQAAKRSNSTKLLICILLKASVTRATHQGFVMSGANPHHAAMLFPPSRPIH